MYYPKDLVNGGGKVKKATCLSFHSMWLCCDNALYRPVHHLWAQVREALWPDQLGDTGQTMMNSASVDLARRISDLPVEQLWDNHIFLLSIFFFSFFFFNLFWMGSLWEYAVWKGTISHVRPGGFLPRASLPSSQITNFKKVYSFTPLIAWTPVLA